MSMRTVLMIMEQCNPAWASVPLVGFNFYDHISRRARVTLVTHERNRGGLEAVRDGRDIVYIPESGWIKMYYKGVEKLTSRGGVNWPLQHALSYPVYAAFNAAVYRRFAKRVLGGEWELVHAMTPILPRYPVKIIRACGATPFLLGPVNGGLPFPEGFSDVARKERARFNFLRIFSRMLPGYSRTYQEANMVLAGSSHTRGMLADLHALPDERLGLFFENGVREDFFITTPKQADEKGAVHILFVGRLTAYKGCDIALRAVARVRRELDVSIRFSIVGDGEERRALESLAHELELADVVEFTGWIPQEKTREYYRRADLFCFPSVREFGGAVILEAMAAGLPCVTADHGGVGEYVTEDCGVRTPPSSPRELEDGVAEALIRLVGDPRFRESMSANAVARAREFEWGAKANAMIGIYETLIHGKQEGRP